MIDVITRACLHPFDYVGIVRQHRISLRNRIEEGHDIFTFEFEKPARCNWKSGQHAIFRFPDKAINGRTWRPFSIASSPHEQVVRMSTIISADPSDFKRNLLSLQPGDELVMNGPFGEFHAGNGPQHIVGVAGGIGITPFRALAYDIANDHTHTKLTLIYGAQHDAYTFQKDLEEFQHSDKIEVKYLVTPEEINTELDYQWHTHGNLAAYYISGAPRMIGALRETLKKKGAAKIVNDPFKGY